MAAETLEFAADGSLEYDAGAPSAEQSNYFFSHGGSGGMFPTGKPTHVIAGRESDGFHGRVVYSPDGKRRAYFGPLPKQPGQTDEQRHLQAHDQGSGDLNGLYVDDTLYGPAAGWNEHLEFSPDGRHVAYLRTGSSGDNAFVVVDGVAEKYPLAGYVSDLRFTAADTLVALTTDARSEMRRVEVKLLPVPAAATIATAGGGGSPARAPAGAAAGSPEAEAAVAKLRKIAAAAGEGPAANRILRQVPRVYAAMGDRDAALAADEAIASTPAAPTAASTTRPARGARDDGFAAGSEMEAYGPGDFGFVRDDSDPKATHRIALLKAALHGQVRKGDKAGAAAMAGMIEKTARAVENVALPENARYLHAAATGWAEAGETERAAAVMKEIPGLARGGGGFATDGGNAPLALAARADALIAEGKLDEAAKAVDALSAAGTPALLLTRLAAARAVGLMTGVQGYWDCADGRGGARRGGRQRRGRRRRSRAGQAGCRGVARPLVLQATGGDFGRGGGTSPRGHRRGEDEGPGPRRPVPDRPG